MSTQDTAMSNKEFITATECVLAYAGHTKEEIDTYISVLEHLAKHFELSRAKSLRYEHDIKLMKSVQTANSQTVTITCPSPKGELELTLVEYYVRSEVQPRYAFFSEAFTKSFSVRFFSDARTFSRFTKQGWIDVLDTYVFWNSTIVKYHSQSSTVDRFAVHFTDYDKSFEDFQKLATAEPKAETADATGFFGE